MRRVSTSFELTISATLLVLGLYMVYQGSLNSSPNDAVILLGGAVCFSLSLVALGFAVPSILWHREMLRRVKAANEKIGGRQLECGSSTYAAIQKESLSKVTAALSTLKCLNVPFRGPLVAPHKKRIIYVVDGCLLSESEVVAFHEGGHFSAGNIGKLLSDLKRLQRADPSELEAMIERDPGNRRRSKRVMLQIAVLIKAEIPEGKRMQTQAFTVEVNAHGGLLESPCRMAVGQKITLVNPQSGKEINCWVVRIHKTSGEDFTIAFEFEQHSARFWPIDSPPLDWPATAEVTERGA